MVGGQQIHYGATHFQERDDVQKGGGSLYSPPLFVRNRR